MRVNDFTNESMDYTLKLNRIINLWKCCLRKASRRNDPYVMNKLIIREGIMVKIYHFTELVMN